EEAKNYTNALTRIGLCYQKLGQFKIAQSTSPTFISAAGAYYSIARTHLETAETLCMRISARAPAKTLMGESMKMQNEVKKLIEINESLLNGLHTDYGFDAKDLSQDQLLSYRYEGLPAKAPSIISSDQKLSLLLLAAFTDEYLASPQSSTELSPV
ncbi:MAG: hypothetical protein EBX40_07085, partial [Gammaproteobacteria bacterium]|nr:hypothetical protein [Gammaproteobacteria bacterium]